MVSRGTGNERLNTVPLPELPPAHAVPYRVLPDKCNSSTGFAPSLLKEPAVKLCRVVKTVPSVLSLNTVPLPEMPPPHAVPYRVLPDKINPPYGVAPSLFSGGEPWRTVKLCRGVKPVPLVLSLNTVPLPALTPSRAVPYRVLPDKINPAFGIAPSLPPVKL